MVSDRNKDRCDRCNDMSSLGDAFEGVVPEVEIVEPSSGTVCATQEAEMLMVSPGLYHGL